ncbi:MAG TPA: hypothetical protein VLD19_02030 [Chitinophagaceae bacterium]|nr:hypothetical protein [Chitinophagaceae bacterium]
MKEKLASRIEKLAKRASKSVVKADVKPSGNSSLHQIIKTKQQADMFMKLLKEA